MKSALKLLSAPFLVLILSACNRVSSNVHVLTTSDCGASWRVVPIGDTVPVAVGTCGYNTAVPNWPMAGDAEFRTQFQHGVIANVKFSYIYDIEDPLAYIKEARYLGKMGGSLELSSENIGDRFEMAENTIIDKRLREIMTEITRSHDVVTLDPAKLEQQVQDQITKHLKKNGIAMGDIAMVVELDHLTRLSIDTLTAVRLFDAAGEGTVGREILKNRAAAPQIHVTQSAPGKPHKD